MLTQFTQTDLLRSIGEYRIAKLLNHFTTDLLQANIQIPNREQQNGQYLDSVAGIFRDSSRLPHRMLQTLLTLESATTSENQDRLEEAIQRQPDELSLRDCVLDRAIELWFVAPEELSQFATPPSQIQNPTSETSSPERGFSTRSNVDPAIAPDADNTTKEQFTSLPQIENQNSKIKNDDEVALSRLAALNPLEYDRVRKAEAH